MARVRRAPAVDPPQGLQALQGAPLQTRDQLSPQSEALQEATPAPVSAPLASPPPAPLPGSVTTLTLQSADLDLELYVPHPRQGHRLHLGRGHLSLAVCRVRGEGGVERQPVRGYERQ